jgi:hypothetical protein
MSKKRGNENGQLTKEENERLSAPAPAASFYFGFPFVSSAAAAPATPGVAPATAMDNKYGPRRRSGLRTRKAPRTAAATKVPQSAAHHANNVEADASHDSADDTGSVADDDTGDVEVDVCHNSADDTGSVADDTGNGNNVEADGPSTTAAAPSALFAFGQSWSSSPAPASTSTPAPSSSSGAGASGSNKEAAKLCAKANRALRESVLGMPASVTDVSIAVAKYQRFAIHQMDKQAQKSATTTESSTTMIGSSPGVGPSATAPPTAPAPSFGDFAAKPSLVPSEDTEG